MDKLRDVVKNIRNLIVKNGGIVKFQSKFIDFEYENEKLKVLYIENNITKYLICDDLVLALGYSARDTLRHLYNKGVKFEQKAFSVTCCRA